jgi:hypothetical protein
LRREAVVGTENRSKVVEEEGNPIRIDHSEKRKDLKKRVPSSEVDSKDQRRLAEEVDDWQKKIRKSSREVERNDLNLTEEQMIRKSDSKILGGSEVQE